MDILKKYSNFIFKGFSMYMPLPEYKRLCNFFYDKEEIHNEIYIILHEENKLFDVDIDRYILKKIQKAIWRLYKKYNFSLDLTEFDIPLCSDEYTDKQELIEKISDFINENTISKTIEVFQIKDTLYIRKLLSNLSLRKTSPKSVRRDKKYIKVDDLPF